MATKLKRNLSVESGRRWGNWEYRQGLKGDSLVLWFKKNYPYEIELERVNTAEKVGRWLIHLSATKRFFTGDDALNFLRMIEELYPSMSMGLRL